MNEFEPLSLTTWQDEPTDRNSEEDSFILLVIPIPFHFSLNSRLLFSFLSH